MRVKARLTLGGAALWLLVLVVAGVLTWVNQPDAPAEVREADGDYLELGVQDIELLYGLSPLDAGLDDGGPVDGGPLDGEP